jgi:hypothetical protein
LSLYFDVPAARHVVSIRSGDLVSFVAELAMGLIQSDSVYLSFSSVELTINA